MDYVFHKKLICRLPAKPVKTSFDKNYIKQFFQTTQHAEALYLASPNLLSSYQKWYRGESFSSKDEQKLINALLKYMLRMHHRCTPFGLFVACGTTEWGKLPSKFLVSENYTRSTRLDMHFSVSLAMHLAKDADIKPHLKFYPNSSLYTIGEKVRYVEYFYQNNARHHQINAVDDSPYLDKILSHAKKGKTIDELASTITDDDVTKEDAKGFVDQMIEAQLLISELEPGVTGDELTLSLLKKLKTIRDKRSTPTLQGYISLIQSCLIKIEHLDQHFNDAEAYQSIERDIEKLGVEFDRSKLFQSDLFLKPQTDNGNTIDESLKKRLIRALKVVNVFSDKHTNSHLKSFKERFYKKYEDQEVPLLHALDSETGVGYGDNKAESGMENPLLEGLMFPSDRSSNSIKWNERQNFLLDKIVEAIKKGNYSIDISENEVRLFDKSERDLPISMSLSFSLLNQLENGSDLVMNGVMGPSATNLLSRFGSGNEAIREVVQEIAAEEDNHFEGRILAEIVHLPQNRAGNILMRPQLRQYEIPYLSASSMGKGNQISAQDLMISIKNERIVLRSKRLNKEVVPRMANAHAFEFNSLPVYQFLCELQLYNKKYRAHFNWGVLANKFDFLPRVTVHGVIVSPASWALGKEQIQEFVSGKLNSDLWRKKYNLPETVFLTNGDNELLIDFSNTLSIQMLIGEIKNKSSVHFKEYFKTNSESPVTNELGEGYSNEFIATLIKSTKTGQRNTADLANKTTNNSETKRSFALGSEWLYYKIYSGVKTADKILTEVIAPITNQLKDSKLIDRWFFIRYGDPEHHLRFRLHLADVKHLGAVINCIHQVIEPYIEKGLIWKVQTDQYQRELERYGNNSIDQAEKLFTYNSSSIVSFLSLIDGRQGESLRWQFGMYMVDNLLSAFQYSKKQKLALLETLKTGYAREFNTNKQVNKSLNKKYRLNEEYLKKILTPACHDQQLAPLFDLLTLEYNSIKPIAKEILYLDKTGELQVPLNDLLSSYIHMVLNRLFKSHQRMHELVVYDFMWKMYRTEIMKQKFG